MIIDYNILFLQVVPVDAIDILLEFKTQKKYPNSSFLPRAPDDTLQFNAPHNAIIMY
jgi:hypothetical protein